MCLREGIVFASDLRAPLKAKKLSGDGSGVRQSRWPPLSEPLSTSLWKAKSKVKSWDLDVFRRPHEMKWHLRAGALASAPHWVKARESQPIGGRT